MYAKEICNGTLGCGSSCRVSYVRHVEVDSKVVENLYKLSVHN